MELLTVIGQRRVGSRNYLFGQFLCPTCLGMVEKIKRHGLMAKSCSHKCYSKDRSGVRRGPYQEAIINKGYRYKYLPEHPNAVGTRKLYVAEHRLVMEGVLGRYLTDEEVVHHKNKNTLDNDPENLEVMSASEHIRLHAEQRKRDRDGKFST